MEFISDILDKSPHYDKAYEVGKNEIVFSQAGKNNKIGQFYGKPISYWDGVEWKGKNPELAEKGGFYAGEGTHFKILPTGEIQATSNYRQHTKGFGYYSLADSSYLEAGVLPSAGVVQNNKLIKDLGSDYQWKVAELGSGVKQELIIHTKPSNMSGDLFVMATEVYGQNLSIPDGRLSDGVLYEGLKIEHAGIAWDSSGRVCPVEAFIKNLPGPKIIIYYGVPVSWLDSSDILYPVVIDPVTDFDGDSGDAAQWSVDGSWSACRANSDGFSTGTDLTLLLYNHSAGGDDYQLYRGFPAFDTSAIPSGAVFNSLSSTFYVDASWNSGGNYDVHMMLLDWEYPMTSGNYQAAWDNALTASQDVVLCTTGQAVGSFTKTGISTDCIQGESVTKLALVHDRDLANSAINGMVNRVDFRSSNHATAGDRPYVTIDYIDVPAPSTIGLKSGLLSPSIGLYDTRVKLRSKRRDVALSTKVRNDQ